MIGTESPSFGRNAIFGDARGFRIQHRFFVNEPWELMAEAIARAVGRGPDRNAAQSFRRQAEDYFRAASAARELAVRPVLLYYAFLNLTKALGIAKGYSGLAGKAYHGISWEPGAGRLALSRSLVKFPTGTGIHVFPELLKLLNGNGGLLGAPLPLQSLLPQILPGHRLWCYATDRPERFLTVEKFILLHNSSTKGVWLNIFLNRDDVERVGLTIEKIISRADLDEFELESSNVDTVCLQQRKPDVYSTQPGEALVRIMDRNKNRFWETVKTASPYRKHYAYCSPPTERSRRLPQMASIYALMFFLSSVTRYSPQNFDDLLDSKFGPFFDTFISESPMQFLYLLASDMLDREISKPAII